MPQRQGQVRLWLPSQKGALFVALQPQKYTVPVFSA